MALSHSSCSDSRVYPMNAGTVRPFAARASECLRLPNPMTEQIAFNRKISTSAPHLVHVSGGAVIGREVQGDKSSICLSSALISCAKSTHAVLHAQLQAEMKRRAAATG
eukprot:2944018-Pleurochrysis_carterae.AAC.1